MKQVAKKVPIYSITYQFFDKFHVTEISMFIDGKNILAFKQNGELLTTRWNLDELALWMRTFLDNMEEDPYPVDCEGEFAAQKDDAARHFDSDDDEVFDEYYDRIDEWSMRHRWHIASSGAILADVFFQLVGDKVEVSWDNRGVEENVTFQYESGGVRVPKEEFIEVTDAFLKAYAKHWYTV